MSTVYDPILNEIYYGQNYKSKSKMALKEYKNWLANDADPIIRERTAQYQADIDNGLITLGETTDLRLAAHSEVRALDKALSNRRKLGMLVDETTLSELYLYNIDLRKAFDEGIIVPKDRCENCRRITKGINTIIHN